MKKWQIGLLIILATGTVPVQAKVRIWTDRKGNTIEAEYVSMLAGKVVLKTPKGRQIKIPTNDLSQKDMEYLRSSIPPKIAIDVDIKYRGGSSSSTWYGHSERSKSAQIHATLIKKSNAPSDQQFTAWLYLFSKDLNGSGIVVAEVSLHEFFFGGQKKIELSGKSHSFEESKYSSSYSYGYRYGDRCAGYLVCIVDSNDKVILVDASSKKYKEKAKNILGRGAGSQFDNAMEPTGPDRWLSKKRLKQLKKKQTKDRINFDF